MIINQLIKLAKQKSGNIFPCSSNNSFQDGYMYFKNKHWLWYNFNEKDTGVVYIMDKNCLKDKV